MGWLNRVDAWQERRPRFHLAIMEFSLMTSLFGLYFVTRGIAAGRAYDAFQHAFLIMRIEQTLGIAVEQALQRLVLASPPVLAFLNWVYTYGHMWTVLVFGIWVYLRLPEFYRIVRATFLAILGGGLSSYILFPVAPPRFFPWRGYVDTLALTQGVNYDHPGIVTLYNPFAAMPSLHVAFSFFVGIGLWRLVSRNWLRAVAVCYPLLMVLAVIGTGNHYVLDCLAGAALAAGAWYLTPRYLGSPRQETAFRPAYAEVQASRSSF